MTSAKAIWSKKHHGDMLKRKSKKKKKHRIVKYSITYMKVDGRVRKKTQ